MKILRTLVWIIPMAGVGLAAVILVGGMASANGAPQEAVVAALACAVAILPYCFSRAVSEVLDTWKSPEREASLPAIADVPEARNVQPRIFNDEFSDDSVIAGFNPWKVVTIVAAVVLLGGLLVTYFAVK